MENIEKLIHSDYTVMRLSDADEYLMHYGRKGMKWYQHIFTSIQKSKKARTKRKVESLKRKQKIALEKKKLKDIKDDIAVKDKQTIAEMKEAEKRINDSRKISLRSIQERTSSVSNITGNINTTIKNIGEIRTRLGLKSSAKGDRGEKGGKDTSAKTSSSKSRDILRPLTESASAKDISRHNRQVEKYNRELTKSLKKERARKDKITNSAINAGKNYMSVWATTKVYDIADRYSKNDQRVMKNVKRMGKILL